MPVTTICNRQVHVNEEGFLTDPTEWDEALGNALANQIGIDLGDEHWKAIRFLRQDYADQKLIRWSQRTCRRSSSSPGSRTATRRECRTAATRRSWPAAFSAPR